MQWGDAVNHVNPLGYIPIYNMIPVPLQLMRPWAWRGFFLALSGLSMTKELIRVLIVGGNAISAFLSWRLQATNSCDVTLVWKSGFESVSQYGISFKYVTRAAAVPVR